MTEDFPFAAFRGRPPPFHNKRRACCLTAPVLFAAVIAPLLAACTQILGVLT